MFTSRPTCTFKTFWAGFTDWWAERCNPQAATKSSAPAKPTTNRVVQAMLLVALLVAAPVFAMLFAPLAASTMSAAGTTAVAWIAQAGAIIIGLGFLIGLPVWAGWKVLRFCRTMCERGHDILAGRRPRVRLL